jgi:DnaJ-class molecular chaperone
MQMRMEEDLSDQNELYTVLGVQQTATYEEVKKAFRAKGIFLL